jgi:hypothetical protein
MEIEKDNTTIIMFDKNNKSHVNEIYNKALKDFVKECKKSLMFVDDLKIISEIAKELEAKDEN